MKRTFTAPILILIVLILVPTVAAAPNAGWSVRGQHTVKAGETLFCIGRAYGVDPWAIAAQNGIVNPNLIHPDIVLAIPDAPATLPPGPTCTPQFGGTQPPVACGDCTCTHQHLVVTGDTLFKIASMYNVDMHTLANCNCLYNLNYIRIGDTLCVP